MSRILVVVCCAIVSLWGFGISQEVVSQDQLGMFASESEQSPVREAEDRIDVALDRELKSPLDFTELPLNEILRILQDDYEIPIVLDLAALDEVAISPEEEITISLRNISLRNALKFLLRQPGVEDLTFLIDQEVLMITTEDRASKVMTTEVYRVDDLDVYPPMPKAATAWASYSPLIGAITTCVEKSSWKENGTGAGEIQLVSPGILVISQTHRVHSQIEELFRRLRQVRKDIATSGGSNAQSKFDTRGFLVDQNLAKASQDEKNLIANSITESVDWGEQADDKVWIRIVGKRILARHRTEVLNEVQTVLGKMRLVAPYVQVGSGGGGFGGDGGGGAF